MIAPSLSLQELQHASAPTLRGLLIVYCDKDNVEAMVGVRGGRKVTILFRN